jgi:uncharacterized protein
VIVRAIFGATQQPGVRLEVADARPVWTGYVAVDDVDAFAARVKQAGGAIHRAPDDIPRSAS